MIVLFLAFILNVCPALAEDHGAEHKKVHTILAQRPAKESLIPKEVVAKVKESLVYPKEKQPQAEKGKEAPKKKLTFMSAEVHITEDHPHLLPDPVKVITPMGGGSVELSRLIPQGKGRFRVGVVLKTADKTEVMADKVYFVPKIQRKKSVEPHDKHCGQFFDVSTLYAKELGSDKGFETYFTDGIFAFNLVGSFVFVKEDEHQVLISNVNFTDSRFDAFLCPKNL